MNHWKRLGGVWVCFIVLMLTLPIPHSLADYTLSPDHPRVMITPNELATIVDRMSGSNAREPYSGWYDRIRQREIDAQSDPGKTPHLMSLALLYHAESDPIQKENFRTGYLTELETYMAACAQIRRDNPTARSGPSLASLLSMDLMWEQIPDAVKLDTFEAGSGDNAFAYQSGLNLTKLEFDYHGAVGHAPAFVFAALFDGDAILSHPQVTADPDTYSFDTALYINAMQETLSDTGHFRLMENRIAGDPTYNSALPGDFGGMYDNMGYDKSEDSWSIYLVSAFSTATGQDRLDGFLHDQYRAHLYQHMEIPYTAEQDGEGENAHTLHRFEMVWNTQTDWKTSPNLNTLALVAAKYQDPRMQYYADRWRKILNTYAYDYYTTEIWRMLCFYDDRLEIIPPSGNPTARYFSGPGLVSMRENWSDEAAFAVFMAGEGISRRYEDANSFVLSRKTPIVVQAGARIRFNEDNNKHHWYHIRSISKNTLKIFDPQESFDVDSEGRITALHSGTPLVNSDNMGGQLHETGISGQDGVYTTGFAGTLESRRSTAFELGIWNTADITAYEHVPDAYTYTRGDGTDAYTRKIDYFEREFLYLRPDIFVLFDRVQSADPDFTKAWTLHTVDQPVAESGGADAGQGGTRYTDARRFTIRNGLDQTTLYTLLPRSSDTMVRGGDTALATGHPLNNGTPIEGAALQACDMPRWLELFAVGPDTLGSVTLFGDAQEGTNTSETITFDGTAQSYFRVSSLSEAGTRVVFFDNDSLRHDGMQWQPGQWTGYMVQMYGGAGELVEITDNSADRLQFARAVDAGSVWSYAIVRPMANTTLHWRRITRITTTDMEVNNFMVSAPHYFDARGADGTLYSFAPHTDGKDDGYTKRTDYGQWTMDVETVNPERLTHFLNIFHLADPGATPPDAAVIEGDTASGALIGGRLVMFAHTPDPLDEMQFDCPQGEFDALIMNLRANTPYYVAVENGRAAISTTPGQGSAATTSAMGVLRTTLINDGVNGGGTGGDGGSDGGGGDGSSGDSGGSGGGGGCFIDALR